MTRPFDKHLDSDELNSLASLRETSVSAPEQLSESTLRDAQRHVESCQDCSRRLQRHQFVHSEILRMRLTNPSPPTPECVGGIEWLEVAAGLLPVAKTRELMKHAAQCEHCGPLLKNAAEALVDEATPGEEVLLASLQSARPEWRRNMAATLRDSARDRQQKSPWWRAVFSWPTPAYVFAGTVAVALVAWIGVLILHPPSAEQLLAQAYTEHRTLEVRIPGAKYAPMQAQRGTEQSNFDRPQSLLKAEALISGNLTKNPNDPVWLQARGRAELLDSNYESAIKSLQRALEVQPDSPGLLTDLGSAYFLRAESTDRPIDYANSIESFGKALAKTPDDPIALFNRALACERMFLYTQAEDDWEHYLRVDSQGEWSDDVRNRLSTLQERIKRHDKSDAEPLLTPEQIAKAGTEDTALRAKIDGRFEDYLNVAIKTWLPRAYPLSQGRLTDALVVRSALNTLADISTQNHNDTWLVDVLAASESPTMPRAFADLADAVMDNDKADTSAARQHASEAARIFSITRNDAGAIRAKLEHLVAINIAQDGNHCMEAASKLKREANGRPYPWILSQIHNETGSCLFLLENLGLAHTEYGNALREADRGRYSSLGLRAQDHICVLDGASGDIPSGWRTASDALARFWSGVYPKVRAYNIYYGIYELSREARQPHLQMAAWRDGLALVESSPDTAQRAIAHSLMATAAQTASQPQMAEQEFARASQLFSISPQIESTRIAAIEAEARLAAVENAQGRSARAIARLKPLETEITKLSDNFLAILFYTTLGDAESRQGEDQSADSSLRSAIDLAEIQLRSLRDDKGRIDWDQQSAGAYRNLVQLRLSRGDTEGAFALWEWYRGAVLRSGHSSTTATGSPAFPMAEASAQIPKPIKETVLSYALLPGGLATWVYDDRGVTSRWSTLQPDELEAKAAAFRRLCSTRDADESAIRRQSQTLYELLVSPIDQQLSPDRTLVVELDAGLAGLPFEALLDGQNRYLGERLSIVYSLGIYYRSIAHSSAAITAESTVLIAAVPASMGKADPSVLNLPDVTTEGQMVSRIFRSATLLVGRDATAMTVHSGLPRKSVFHFAGHAFSSAGQTGLLLADGLMTVATLKRNDIADLDLAVFSACDTQDGSTGDVTDADSLARSFLRAGVPYVIASRWNVDSGASLQFMRSFYRALLAGNNVAVSIHQAQTDLRSYPGMANPYYWSAFSTFSNL